MLDGRHIVFEDGVTGVTQVCLIECSCYIHMNKSFRSLRRNFSSVSIDPPRRGTC